MLWSAATALASNSPGLDECFSFQKIPVVVVVGGVSYFTESCNLSLAQNCVHNRQLELSETLEERKLGQKSQNHS